ncbi:MAG TPA: hypothetical protein VNT22_11370 [Baekduia sp.]|nr:hypothetical protein [Baekduia sp.]
MSLSNNEITYIVAAACTVLALAAYVGWILIPAWVSYTRVWQRFAAAFLSLYVLAAFMGIGVLGGALITYFWDRIHL